MSTNHPDPLLATLRPASIAVVGASDNPNKVGGRPIHYMNTLGYAGRLYPINPGRDTLQGLTCYPSLSALPEVPELVVIVVSGDEALACVLECAERGVAAVIVIASGFGEVDEQGARRQQQMVDAARRAGMRMIGPNSQGFADFSSAAITSFSTMFIEYPPADGPVSVVSQSGALSAAAYGLLRSQGIGVRHVLATGNEADVTVADVADRVVDDPDLGLVILYMEHIARPQVLADAAAKARARGLPVVALKTGRTQSGQAMASSHTGSLANEDTIVDAFLRAHGILRVEGLGELVRIAPLMLAGRKATGRRLIAISNSGASCVMSADAAEKLGLQLARIPDATAAALRDVLPSFSTSRNPIDLTGALLSDSALFGKVLAVLADNDDTDLVHIDLPVAGQGYDLAGFARAAADFADRSGKSVTVSCWQPSVAKEFRAVGLPVYDTIEQGLGAVADWVHHSEIVAAAQRRQPLIDAGSAATQQNADHPNAMPDRPRLARTATGFLNEADSLAVLAEADLPTVPYAACTAENPVPEAIDALARFGAPVVLKACSSTLPHKSELGLVSLNLRDDEALTRAYEQQRAALAQAGAAAESFLVAPMRAGRRELLLGARRDRNFGVSVLIGDGGRYVEAMPDTALLLWPFDEADVLEALRGLRVWPVLAGTRGEPALDVEAFAKAARQLGALAARLDDQIASIEANPVMIGANGEGVWIVDALVECAPEA